MTAALLRSLACATSRLASRPRAPPGALLSLSLSPARPVNSIVFALERSFHSSPGILQLSHPFQTPCPGNADLASSAVAPHGGKGRPKPGEGITLHFKKPDGEIVTVEANEGDDIVDVSWEYDLDIEAACEKSVACSTCHVILEEDVYDKLEEPDDDENDMLDLAFGLTDT
ncbi:hypothetical protein C6P46_005152 [Rhodotorula mucilaginosa]|uniref:2Fe-2S ferredoxin-type domain-containing protein n=1 Tax=Rhodotorula mucilaginosa TaxID=5537 RepID=A0A9P7B4W5_RHOMI|nr:hypothetical protein C6P46_005152 [Rhodotorula mucilaginosa]